LTQFFKYTQQTENEENASAEEITNFRNWLKDGHRLSETGYPRFCKIPNATPNPLKGGF